LAFDTKTGHDIETEMVAILNTYVHAICFPDRISERAKSDSPNRLDIVAPFPLPKHRDHMTGDSSGAFGYSITCQSLPWKQGMKLHTSEADIKSY